VCMKVISLKEYCVLLKIAWLSGQVRYHSNNIQALQFMTITYNYTKICRNCK
jgi:hypothetical protein